MRTIKQLAVETNATDTSTTQVTELRHTVIEADIFRFGEDFRILQNIVDIKETSGRDYAVTIPISTSHLDVTNTAPSETDIRTWTELTNLDTVTITPTIKLGGVVISKQVFETSTPDLIDQAKWTIAQDLEEDVEKAIIVALEANSNNFVYGGDAVSTATLEAGDTISPDVMVDAVVKLEVNNFNPTAFIIHPYQAGALRKDSQFVNASEWGSDRVIRTGEIGEWQGIPIFKTTNVTAQAGWGSAGHECFLIGEAHGRVGITLVWKERPSVSTEFDMRRASHYIYYDAWYATAITQDKAICSISVTDA